MDRACCSCGEGSSQPKRKITHMAQNRTATVIMHPLTIAEGITRHCNQVSIGRKTFYEMVTTVDGEALVTTVRTSASAALWMDQAREDAAEYAADLDMQDAARSAVAAKKAQHRAVSPAQLVMGFCQVQGAAAAQLALAL